MATIKLFLFLLLLLTSTISSGQHIEFNVKLSKPPLVIYVDPLKSDIGVSLTKHVSTESKNSHTKHPNVGLNTDVSLKVHVPTKFISQPKKNVQARKLSTNKKRSFTDQPVCKMSKPITDLYTSTCAKRPAKKKCKNYFSNLCRVY